MMTRVCSKHFYEQTGTKATKIHSYHCLYCDTIFPQFDDSIKHSRENHPYHCYYCKTTFVLFEEVIKHSTENQGSLMLKVKYLELNPSSGHYGCKSHNFNVIPEKIKALVPVVFVIFFGTKPGHHAVTSFTKPCLLISIIKSTK